MTNEVFAVVCVVLGAPLIIGAMNFMVDKITCSSSSYKHAYDMLHKRRLCTIMCKLGVKGAKEDWGMYGIRRIPPRR
jgi:hypothetical protein